MNSYFFIQLISTSLNLKQQDQGFFENSKDSVCYQIVAESNGTPTWISQSNLICLKKLPIVWIPNSFTPDNNLINPIFIPTLVGINDNDYQLIIYNRWGSIIFKTNSKNQGWDGNFQSIPAPIGVYYYHLSFSYYNEKGIIIKENKNGTIQLLR